MGSNCNTPETDSNASEKDSAVSDPKICLVLFCSQFTLTHPLYSHSCESSRATVASHVTEMLLPTSARKELSVCTGLTVVESNLNLEPKSIAQQ